MQFIISILVCKKQKKKPLKIEISKREKKIKFLVLKNIKIISLIFRSDWKQKEISIIN